MAPLKHPQLADPEQTISSNLNAPPSEPEQVECDYEFRVGAFVRSRTRFEIERAASEFDVDVRIIEDRRWLSSVFLVRISGLEENVDEFYDALDEWVGGDTGEETEAQP